MKFSRIVLVLLILVPTATAQISVGLQPEEDKELGSNQKIDIFAEASTYRSNGVEYLRIYSREDAGEWVSSEEMQASGCADGYCSVELKESQPAGTTIEFKAKARSRDGSTYTEGPITIEWISNSGEDEDNGETDQGKDASVSLGSPANDAEDVGTNPSFRFTVTDEDSYAMESVTLAIEEKHGSSDSPWSYYGEGQRAKTYTVTEYGSDVYVSGRNYAQQFDFSGALLDPGKSYVWAVKADDGDGDEPAKSEIRSFTTEEEDEGDGEDEDNGNGDDTDWNEDPHADLVVTPDRAESGTRFKFDASDSDDDDGFIDFYRYDFDGDGDWDRTTSDSVVYKRIYDDGRKEARVRAVDNDGAADTDEYDYTVTSDDDVPEIELRSPEDGEEVDPDVRFRWKITDGDDSSMDDTKLVVEEKDYNGDRPWDNGKSYDISDMTDLVQSRTVDLDEDTVYVWGIKADDGQGGYHRSEVFEFTTTEDDGDGDYDGDEANLEIEVEDEDGDELDAEVEVEGPEDESGTTGSDGEIDFDLEPGDYEVTVSKSGYRTETEDIELSEGEEETLDFELEREPEDIEVLYARIPRTVCRGDDLTAEIGITNNGGSEHLELRLVAGSSIAGKDIEIDKYSTELRRITAENIGGEEFNAVLMLENGRERRFTQEVKVNDCGSTDDISVNVRPREITYGQNIEVSGYVEAEDRRQQVEVFVDGIKLGETTTDRRGRYSLFVRPTNAGRQDIRVEAGQATARSSVNVIPTVNVASLKLPERSFQSREFEVCAEVKSQVTPQVQLVRDGTVIDSKSAEGDVCFDTSTVETGEHTYGILASAYGVRSGQEREIEVLELGSEVDTFPEKVATVRAEDGLVKVEVYNNREDSGLYEVSVDGLPNGWFTTTDKAFELAKGDRKTVYFYFVPEREGRFYTEIEVSRNGEQIQTTNVPIKAQGTTQPQVTWHERIRSLFPSW
ncbi:carboxypeptidase-like regulatory domain-containing protein [Candidatus Nanohalococcus occultus]|uniref:Membrane protein n=1 Tax=Candidatus Nanohalococcus occultus TaxID=2978047 RepID=A0ABY8CHM4_9ARCH|nr:Putative membrane protein [Candidatus Nanohaloarchaeota archaeon SVXNc]